MLIAPTCTGCPAYSTTGYCLDNDSTFYTHYINSFLDSNCNNQTILEIPNSWRIILQPTVLSRTIINM